MFSNLRWTAWLLFMTSAVPLIELRPVTVQNAVKAHRIAPYQLPMDMYNDPNFATALENELRLRHLLQELAMKSHLIGSANGNAGVSTSQDVKTTMPNNESEEVELTELPTAALREQDTQAEGASLVMSSDTVDYSERELSSEEEAQEESASEVPNQNKSTLRVEDKMALKAQLDFLQLNAPSIKNYTDVVGQHGNSSLDDQTKFYFMSNKTEHKLEPLPTQTSAWSGNAEDSLEAPTEETAIDVLANEMAERVSEVEIIASSKLPSTERPSNSEALNCQSSLECLKTVGSKSQHKSTHADDTQVTTSAQHVANGWSKSPAIAATLPEVLSPATTPHSQLLRKEVSATVTCYTDYKPAILKVEASSSTKANERVETNDTIKSVDGFVAENTNSKLNHTEGVNVRAVENVSDGDIAFTEADELDTDADAGADNDDTSNESLEAIDKSTIEQESPNAEETASDDDDGDDDGDEPADMRSDETDNDGEEDDAEDDMNVDTSDKTEEAVDYTIQLTPIKANEYNDESVEAQSPEVATDQTENEQQPFTSGRHTVNSAHLRADEPSSSRISSAAAAVDTDDNKPKAIGLNSDNLQYGKQQRKGPGSDSDEGALTRSSASGIHFNETEITTTNWWRTLPYAEIRKFLNTIFDSAAHELYEEIVAARKSKKMRSKNQNSASN